jgi:hypothetical protein
MKKRLFLLARYARYIGLIFAIVIMVFCFLCICNGLFSLQSLCNLYAFFTYRYLNSGIWTGLPDDTTLVFIVIAIMLISCIIITLLAKNEMPKMIGKIGTSFLFWFFALSLAYAAICTPVGVHIVSDSTSSTWWIAPGLH